MSAILMQGHRGRAAAVRSLQRAAEQLARTGDLVTSEDALRLALRVTDDMIVRVKASIERTKNVAAAVEASE